jgi:CheY-like chemotaxis protein
MMTKRILIVDDEAPIRAVLQASLKHFGNWEVVEATSGQEGLYQAANYQPDVILLDVRMPQMDGVEVLHQLRQNALTNAIPVVFLTADPVLLNWNQLASLGVVAILEKPFDSQVLPNQITNACRWEE